MSRKAHRTIYFSPSICSSSSIALYKASSVDLFPYGWQIAKCVWRTLPRYSIYTDLPTFPFDLIKNDFKLIDMYDFKVSVDLPALEINVTPSFLHTEDKCPLEKLFLKIFISFGRIISIPLCIWTGMILSPTRSFVGAESF